MLETTAPRQFHVGLLGLAQRLVLIEVQDNYQQLQTGSRDGDGDGDEGNGGPSAWKSFVEQTWRVLFEDRREKTAEDREARAELEARRLFDARQRRRDGRRRREPRPLHGDLWRPAEATRGTRRGERNALRELRERRVRRPERYLRPAFDRGNRPLFAHHRHRDFHHFVK